jgi:hypothetical protein
MYIKRHSKGTLVSERIYTDFFQEITGEIYNSCYLIALDYDTTLAHILRPFDVPYFFMRHEAVSPKDLYDKITASSITFKKD